MKNYKRDNPLPPAARFAWPASPNDNAPHETGRTRTRPLAPPLAFGGRRYRLARVDSRNIALQRLDPGDRWRCVAYCGNSPAAVARAVTELAARHWTPDEAHDLAAALDALAANVATLERAIRDALKEAP